MQLASGAAVGEGPPLLGPGMKVHMVARAEIERGKMFLLQGLPVTVLSVPQNSALIPVQRGDGSRTLVLPHDLTRVAARRKVTFKGIAKAYGGNEAVQHAEELMRRKAK